MAVYIRIRKNRETADIAQYTFGESDNASGLIEIDKRSGQTKLLEALKGDPDAAYYRRASRKLEQHWALGEFPDLTCWAS